MARKSAPMNCSESDLLELQRVAEQSKNKRLAERAQMVLACAEGKQIKEVAVQFEEKENTVIKWKRRYMQSGIAGLASLPRGNSKDVYGDDFKARLISTFNSPPPEGEQYWTGPLLAAQLDAPVAAVRRYLTKAGIHLNDQRLNKAQELRDRSVNATAITLDDEDENDVMSAISKWITADNADVVSIVSEQDNDNEESKSEVHISNEDAGFDDDSLLDLGCFFVARDKKGNIRLISGAFAKDALVDSDNFNICEMPGFLDDFGRFENGASQVIGPALESFIGKHMADTSKKKRTAEPGKSCRTRELKFEYGNVCFVSMGNLATKLPPKENIVSRGQSDVEEMLCVKGTYRWSATELARLQHRQEGRMIDGRGLQKKMVRVGLYELNADMEYTDKFLDKVGIDPDTLKIRDKDLLETFIKMPTEESLEVKLIKTCPIIANFNSNKKTDYQISTKYVVNIEDFPMDTIYCCLDGILSPHQSEVRNVNGHPSIKSSTWVQNYIIHVQKGKDTFILTADSIKNVFKKFIVFALKNGMAKGAPVVFFSDGAKDIKAVIEKYFTFYPYRFFLDWYHLQKKLREYVSSVFKGSPAEKQKIHFEITSRLWVGNVEAARAYIDSLCPDKVRNESRLEDLRAYLSNKEPYLYCYALRKELGLHNASSPVEKANDRVVARRQKNNSTSWSYTGSWALAAISARRLNQGHNFNWRLTA